MRSLKDIEAVKKTEIIHHWENITPRTVKLEQDNQKRLNRNELQ